MIILYFQTTVKLINSHTAVEVTSFLGRETSGNHKWNPHQEVHLPKYYSMFSNNIKIKSIKGMKRFQMKILKEGDSGLKLDCKNSR